MDAFAVSVTNGLTIRDFNRRHALWMGVWFGGFQFLMPLLGWILGSTVADYVSTYAPYLSFALLAYIGVKMIRESLSGEGEQGMTTLSHRRLLVLAVATSIDALAVGISFTCTGMTTFHSILFPLAAIGIVSSGFSLAGNMVGIFLGRRFHFPVEQTGGLILVVIGVKILLEHLL